MSNTSTSQDSSEILLAQPRGFCAGVDRAINIVNEALKAANILRQRGISLRVLSVGTLKPLEIKEIILAVEQTKLVITIEENIIFGGLAGAVSETCMNEGVFPKKFQALGIPDIFPEVVGDQKYLRKYFKLDAESIVKKIIELQ
jgi:transketolase